MRIWLSLQVDTLIFSETYGMTLEKPDFEFGLYVKSIKTIK